MTPRAILARGQLEIRVDVPAPKLLHHIDEQAVLLVEICVSQRNNAHWAKYWSRDKFESLEIDPVRDDYNPSILWESRPAAEVLGHRLTWGHYRCRMTHLGKSKLPSKTG